MKHLSLLFLIIVLSVGTGYAQFTETKGNILRIDFTKPEIDLGDTLWNWFTKKEGPVYTSNICNRILEYNNSTYIFGEESSMHDFMIPWGGRSYYFYNCSTQSKKYYFGYGWVLDIIWEPYCDVFNKMENVDNGLWLSFGITGNSFINKHDSARIFRPYSENLPILTNIIGNINTNYFIAVKRDTIYPTYDFYIANLSTSPNIQFISKVNLDYAHEDFDLPSRIEQVNDSLYLLKNEISLTLYLANLTDSTLTIIKELKNNFNYSWIFQGNTLFYTEFDGKWNFIKEEFDLSSLTFINKEIILDKITGFYKYDYNYFVTLNNDSLTVYNYQLKQIVNQYNLTNIKYKDSFILSSPYIYLHQILTISDVNNENVTPTQFTLSQNYPNPFNPSTTIEYTIHTPTFGVPSQEGNQRGAFVALKVYDILGREVATLVNEYQQPGKYNVEFRIENSELPSGIYFYTLSVRDQLQQTQFLEAKKMILLKQHLIEIV